MLLSLALLITLAQPTGTTQPPPSTRAAYTVEGRGDQIYRCTQQGATFTWALPIPEAKLIDPSTHQQVGTHSAGPTWTWNDGSAITGKVLEKSSPDPASIPLLLLAATPSGAKTGALSTVVFVRRSDTHGGNPPTTGCDAQHDGHISRVPYTATYTFYTRP